MRSKVNEVELRYKEQESLVLEVKQENARLQRVIDDL